MAVVFGFEPLEFVVVLVRGSDFAFTLQASTDWPAGIGIELRFSTTTPAESASPIVWPAAISGADATWDLDSTQVAQVIDAGARYVRLRYTEPDGSVLVWMIGVTRVV